MQHDEKSAVKPYYRHKLSNDPAVGLALIATGILLLAFVGSEEKQHQAQSVGADSIIVLDEEPFWEGTFPVHTRRLPIENFPTQQAFSDSMKDALIAQGLDADVLNETEWLVAIDTRAPIWAPMLESGRTPHPGSPEVLAGAHTRVNSFEIDGTRFRVVGRIKPEVPGVYFSYLLPYHESFEPHFVRAEAARHGWLDVNGLPRLHEADPSLHPLADLEILGGALAPSPTHYALGALAGLLLVALGGALAQMRLFVLLAPRRSWLLQPLFQEIRRRPVLLLAVHLLLYGVLFIGMAVTIEYPLPNMWMQEIVGQAFSEGNLEYVGTAYSSGNVLLAAGATFVNNYLLQTLALTLVLSLVIPLFGLIKNLASFAIAGLAMTPAWTGMASMYVYHSITMTLELEAYVVASFVVCVWPIRLAAGMFKGSFASEALMAWRVVVGGILLTAVMLAVAALYEAATLMLMMQPR